MKNWYRLSKAELSYLSAIDEPVMDNGKRISTPVVAVSLYGTVVHVWTLKWYKVKVAKGWLKRDPEYNYEIIAMY